MRKKFQKYSGQRKLFCGGNETFFHLKCYYIIYQTNWRKVMKNKSKNAVKLIVMAFFVVILTLLFLFACSTDNSKTPVCVNPFDNEKAGRLINRTDCKNSAGVFLINVNSTHEAITFNYYSGYKILQLSHINAAFNCCPKKITASYKFINDTIKIFEKEAEAGCHCECLYDVNYELRNISEGIYHIEIYGPITDGSYHTPLAFDVDVLNHKDSVFALYRGFYPWME